MKAEILLGTLLQRAGLRCEATRTVRRQTTRCEHCAPVYKLTAAPRDPAIDPYGATAARLPLADLMLWCPECLDRAQAAVRKAARKVTVPAGQMDALTMLEAPCGAGETRDELHRQASGEHVPVHASVHASVHAPVLPTVHTGVHTGAPSIVHTGVHTGAPSTVHTGVHTSVPGTVHADTSSAVPPAVHTTVHGGGPGKGRAADPEKAGPRPWPGTQNAPIVHGEVLSAHAQQKGAAA